MNRSIIPRNPFPHSIREIVSAYLKPAGNFLEGVLTFLGIKKGILVNSGREGLYLTINALLNAGDEIIVPAFTCHVLIEVFEKTNTVPVYADVDRNTLNMELENILSLVNSRTKAVLVTHQFGYPSEMDQLVSFCKEKNILIIEDATPALGAKYKDKFVGTIGDIGVFSFGWCKVISAIEGGLIVGKDDLMDKIRNSGIKEVSSESSAVYFFRAFKNIILLNPYVYNFLLIVWGIMNSKFSRAEILTNGIARYSTNYSTISTFQKTLGFHQLNSIDQLLDVRSRSALLYQQELKDCGRIISIPQSDSLNKFHTYSRFPILVKEKYKAYLDVKSKGVDLGFTFSYKLTQYYENQPELVNTDFIISHILCIPITDNYEVNRELIRKVKSALS